MTQEDKIDRKPRATPIKGMSLYAHSADYERRLSEDCVQHFEPGNAIEILSTESSDQRTQAG